MLSIRGQQSRAAPMTIDDDDDDSVLDVEGAARFLGLAVATLAKMRCMGGSPTFIKAGRRVLYLRNDLLAWLRARRVDNTAQGCLFGSSPGHGRAARILSLEATTCPQGVVSRLTV